MRVLIIILSLTLIFTSASAFSNETIHVSINIPEAHSYQEASAIISSQETNTTRYIERVRAYVLNRIHYITTTRKEVLSPTKAWEAREGDCSEIALLTAAMLQPRVDARVINGIIPGRGHHATVEIHRDHYVRIIDAGVFPTFHKLGDGLGGYDQVVDAIG